MRVLLQRVSRATVWIHGEPHASIANGYCVLLGIGDADEQSDVEWLASKIVQLRVFPDENGLMNRSLADVGGELLLVSQFTLYAATAKGNRPSFIKAARPEKAIPLYEQMINRLTTLIGKPIKTGVFGADMQIELVNDGPVTIWIDSTVRE